MNWYIDCWKKYATFAGRAGRKEFWMFILFNILAYLLAGVLDGIVGTSGLVAGLYSLAVLLPALAVTVRRLHDTNRSAWWLLIGLVPLIGGIWMLLLTVLEGTSGANRFGEEPKA